ncbi:MAG: hypothetical protein PHQ23_15685 [Candidatus Wallbacteria bacterium]|nr:hypothetical protein [Candidatus Wallbacteria bacterium]
MFFVIEQDMGSAAMADNPNVLASIRFSQSLRLRNKTEAVKNDPKQAPNYGILPGSNSHEGYFPGMHSYWDDFFVLRGIKDAIYLAGVLGDREAETWLTEERDDFTRCLYGSINRMIADRKLEYIPGCTEKGDFDSTSTAIAITACDEVYNLPQPQLDYTFDHYWKEFEKGTHPGSARTFTPYEVRSANAFVRMGKRDRALAMLRWFTSDSVRPYGWNHMAEVVYDDPRKPSYIGDMPHTWVGSGYIDAVRTMFVYESGDQLILCAGVDAAWFDKGVSVTSLPTSFGTISYDIRQNGDTLVFSAHGTAAPEGGFVLRLPVKDWDRDVTFATLPQEMELK